MGRIKKAAGPKHEATVSPAVAEFVTLSCALPVSQLSRHLESFPKSWPFPRGDLYHWIPLLNRFDSLFELFISEYGLDAPQTRPFGRYVLEKGLAEENKSANITPSSSKELDDLGFANDGDRQLIQTVLNHSRLLLENCGNRSLYGSSDRLDKFLNTSTLWLTSATLEVSNRLAQRYHTSRVRSGTNNQHLSQAMLASHYNIELEKVQKLADPFTKCSSSPQSAGKPSASTLEPQLVGPNDLLGLLEGDPTTDGTPSSGALSTQASSPFLDWGRVQLSYYPPLPSSKDEQKPPATPTPGRRSSGNFRSSRLSTSEDSAESPVLPADHSNSESVPTGAKLLDIPASEVASRPIEDILKQEMPNLPESSKYELLVKLRTAAAATTSAQTREELVKIRLLALSNLAYIYPDSIIQQKIFQRDSEEARQFQLAQQLTSILHPPRNGRAEIPVKLQAVAVGALEALSRHKLREAEVCSALGINANHGVLFLVLRQVIAEMANDSGGDLHMEELERRDAVLSLLENLPRTHVRVSENLVGAGLFDILVDALNLRTAKAERHHPKIVAILSIVLQTPRESLQLFANAKGLDAISSLIEYEVQSSIKNAEKGLGIPAEFRNPTIDYQIPYFQRETLRFTCKCVSNMLQNNGGNLDRLLRNLMDSPPLLNGLRTIIRNPNVFGASVWSGSVNIMSSFIHNEPTSYSIIAESGLSTSLFESLSGGAIEPGPNRDSQANNGEPDTSEEVTVAPVPSSDPQKLREVVQKELQRSSRRKLAEGILPHVDAILAIPQACGAVCLNNSGKKMLIASNVLFRFFEVFESPEHVKAMNSMALDYDTPRLLGGAFDELVRHHPDLKGTILAAVMVMMTRITNACQSRGSQHNCGAKLFARSEKSSDLRDDQQSTTSNHHHDDGEDIRMEDVAVEGGTAQDQPRKDKAPAQVASSTRSDDEKESLAIAGFIEAAMKFLAGFFDNSGLLSLFIEHHGTTSVLDLLTLPYLSYDFNNHTASNEASKVVHMLAEQKPHLVLPELLSRTLKATENLRPLYECQARDGFFAEFTTPGESRSGSDAAIGTNIARSLVEVQTLCNVLYEVFSSPILNPRNVQTPFSQVNLTDHYRKIVERLGSLHRSCVWEEILLQKRLPERWKEATRIKGYGMGSEEADEVFGFISHDNDTHESGEASTAHDTEASAGPTSNGSKSPARRASLAGDESTAEFKNARTLRYLLSQIPSCIVPCFQSLGKSLTAKKRPEAYLRQNAYLVAEAMSQATIDQLKWSLPKNAETTKDLYAYWIVILTSISQLMIDGPMERNHAQVLSLLLQNFKNDGGLGIIREILDTFYSEVQAFHTNTEETVRTGDAAAKLASAYGGIKIILNFYNQITSPKSITESTQSHAIASMDRDRGNANFFSAQQFLVELRLAVLPNVKELWNSDFVEKASTSITKTLIEILTAILEAADERDAFRRGGDVPLKRRPSHKVFSIASDKLRQLTDKSIDKELAQEALYRCMNNQSLALEYCTYANGQDAPRRFPIPDYDREKSRHSSVATPPHNQTGGAAGTNSNLQSTSGVSSLQDQDASDAADGLFLLAQGGHRGGIDNTFVEVEEMDGDSILQGLMPPPPLPPPAPGVPDEAEVDTSDPMQMSLDLGLDFSNPVPVHAQPQVDIEQRQRGSGADASGRSASESGGNNSQKDYEENEVSAQETVDDLNEERATIKQNLVERVLDILNVHDDVTFELSVLISAAALKDTDDRANREEIGNTLVEALISFTMEEDFRPSGKKIATYAHLLGICVQESNFFEACTDSLAKNMESLFSFIKVFPDQATEHPPIWIGPILLILEKILGEDVQPARVSWKPPTSEESAQEDNSDIAVAQEQIMPSALKLELTETLLEIMPRIGKDEGLVLAIVRVLVILSRYREVASKLSDKRNIQRLFLMIKQLSGMTDQKLPGTFVLVLRHIMEDDEMIKQIMRSEIACVTLEQRPGRYTEISGYVRQMHHLVLRAPELFVEVTNEMIEITKYEKDQPVPSLRFKPPSTAEKKDDSKTEVAEQLSMVNDKDAVEGSSKFPRLTEDSAEEPDSKSKSADVKAPVVEQPSGVVHYLLTELLAYKDVEDTEVGTLVPPVVAQGSNEGTTETSSEPNGASPGSAPPDSRSTDEPKKNEKLDFKPEQYPIYIYRCFILQCLTELLQSYNRAKVEFINFSRKTDPKATTPSKPRSGILNYLLNDVIPVGTLNHEETIAYRKKMNTSNWAISTLVALCLKTNETGHESKPGSVDEDDQADLLFVRKFVLEHSLRAYKDASGSDEYADVKYARLLDISDLFQRLLVGRMVTPMSGLSPPTEVGPQKSIAKLMYERNFIAALTSSIADVDLNFPGAKRAIKYILKPLKQLTQTAVHLSEDSSISSLPDQTEEDEISSATSVSDIAHDREETPDLFRNSTLGMFEPARDEDEESRSGSSGDDEEMYDDEDEEVMEFEEEINRDGDDVISDEDEDLDEAGPIEGLHGEPGMDVEVVIDGEEDDTDDDEDDDAEDDEEPSEDDSDDDDEMDDDNDIEILQEIDGDDENASLAEGEEVDFHGQDDEDDELEVDGGDFDMEQQEAVDDAEGAVRELMQELEGSDHLPARLHGLNAETADLQMDINADRYMDDVIHRGEEDEDEQDEEDDDPEDDIEQEEEMYQPDFDEDDEVHAVSDSPWAFDPDMDEGFVNDRHHHHHHHHHHARHMPRRLAQSLGAFPNGTTSLRESMPLFRSHRPGAGVIRNTDDGTHPLLQRRDRSGSSGLSLAGRSAPSDGSAHLSDFWVHGMDFGGGHRGVAAESPVSFLNSIVAAISNGTSPLGPIAGVDGPLHLQIGGPGGGPAVSSRSGLLPDLQALLGPRRSRHPEPSRSDRDEMRSPLAILLPEGTPQRWQEEARLIWGSSMQDKAIRIINSLLRVLVPPAIEAKKRQEEEAKRLKEEEKKAEEIQFAKEKEEAERQAREKEEREAAERASREAAAQAEAESEGHEVGPEGQSEPGASVEDGAMEGVEITPNGEIPSEPGHDSNANAENTTSESSQPTQRIVTRIGDREIDITSLGIDLAYLDALPEELRQEVLMSQIAIHRSQAAAAGEAPSEISHEFLEALPAEIREELLQQEAQDRRRREREEARRQQQAAGGGPRAEDMDPASFLASLDPTLRQNVLAEQNEDILAHLPAEIAAEARALGNPRSIHRFAGMPGRRTPGLARLLDPRAEVRQPSTTKRAPRKQAVQMLDRAGVATLLRLIFSSQQGSSLDSFKGILRNISENRQTRGEVVSLLLSILQDGSFDVNAIERSFTQLSLRAKQSTLQKTPQPLKRTVTGSIALAAKSVEVTPLTVVQQCLSTLAFLTQANPHIPSFFLTEHDISSNVKSKASRKGKGKETKASKYPLNALLSLLDRKLIMESSACLEQLANLLQSVTHPLNILLKAHNADQKEETPKPAAETTENQETQSSVGGDLPQAAPVSGAPEDTENRESAMAGVQVTESGQEDGAQVPPPVTESAENKQDGTSDFAAEAPPKKARSLTPPVVPDENLRLVVGIIAARECSKTTFQQTVATISNLKVIPGAKEVFGKGLIDQAQDLAQSILDDLDELLPQIQSAGSGVDVHGLALTKFATASSHQSKLLRVLTALDYLFGSKQAGAKANGSAEGDNKEKAGKLNTSEDDMLSTLYENSTFGPLWDKLSECLSAIRQGEGMLNIASILQPLIEALMVVCKNTALRDNALSKNAKEFALASPAPESRMESLFFKFTEEHRKILNDLVRHSPKLMMGTFSLLVKNPKVLEFDNKRSYFTRRLHARGVEYPRPPQPPLQLSVRRDQVFLDSFKGLSFKTGNEIKFGKLSIRFHGEEGVDAGGVTREWFQVLSRQMFNPDYALFVPVASDRTTFHPNKLSKINEEHLLFFKFIGRIIGKALYEGRALDCHFSRAVYKRILGRPVSPKDMETLDLDYYKSLLWMLENDITEIITETFSIETDDFGVTEVVDLIENGRTIPVTEDNKQEYVQRVVEYYLTGSVQNQLEKFLEGFHDIVSPDLISIFNEQELELLISGLPDIDVDDWKNHTEYHNYQASSPQIQWFWRAVRSFDKEERAKLLQFVTGTSKVPLNGFGQLEGMNGFSRFNIHRDYGNKERLPSSHTCFNQLDLPEYETYESLRRHLYIAMTAGGEYFGFA